MSLRRGLNEILQMSAQEEVTQVDELAVVLILDVDDTPSVLATTDLLAIDNDVLLGSYNSEGNKALLQLASNQSWTELENAQTLIFPLRARSSSSNSSLS